MMIRRLVVALVVAAGLLWAGSGGVGADEWDFTTFFVVRHAEKADDGTKDPPLTRAGEARAAALATMLKRAGVGAVFATQYRRTQLTVKPLADALDIEVTVVDASDIDGLIEKARAAEGSVVIAGHSNTVPKIVRQLTGQVFTVTEEDYDDLFVVTMDREGAGHAVRLTYGASDAE
jgi:phosphohistidine phosphatase SixA